MISWYIRIFTKLNLKQVLKMAAWHWHNHPAQCYTCITLYNIKWPVVLKSPNCYNIFHAYCIIMIMVHMHCAFQHKSRLPDIDLNCSIYFNLFLSKIQEVNYRSREVSLQSCWGVIKSIINPSGVIGFDHIRP